MGWAGWSERKETWIYAVTEEEDVAEEAGGRGKWRWRWGERVAFVCWAFSSPPLLLLPPFLAVCLYLREKRLLTGGNRSHQRVKPSSTTANLHAVRKETAQWNARVLASVTGGVGGWKRAGKVSAAGGASGRVM